MTPVRTNFPLTLSSKVMSPVKSNYVKYKEFDPKGNAKIAKGKFLIIEGWGVVIRHSVMPDKTCVNITVQHVLYIPETTRWGTTISQNEVPIIIGQPKSNSEVPNIVITMLSDYTL